MKKPPGTTELWEDDLPEGAYPPFRRYDTLAFHARVGIRPVYLDAGAYRIFIEGARLAGEVYRPKHLAMAFTAEAVKDHDLIALFGTDPATVMAAVTSL